MAGRGRGGKPAVSFDISQLGLARNELNTLGQELQPPPLYPPLEKRPTPLSHTDVDEYLLALSQEFRGMITESAFFMKPKQQKKDIERYTDRYKQKEETSEWRPNMKFFPAELAEGAGGKRRKRQVAGAAGGKKPNIAAARKLADSASGSKATSSLNQHPTDTTTHPASGMPTSTTMPDAVDVAAKLAQLEQIEAANTQVKKEEEEEEEVIEEQYEDDDEDDNDYNFDYYDDGGDAYGGDDDADDGPVY